MRLRQIFALAVIPLIATLLAPPLYNRNGPLWLGENSDPDYAYLMNSLAIINLSPPGHRDHPGTTLQTFGALTIRVTHPTLSVPEINQRVLADPEKYAKSIVFALSVACSLLFFFSGLIMMDALGSLWAALAFQAFPLLTPLVWQLLPRFTPDYPVLALASLMTALVCKAWMSRSRSLLKLGSVFGAIMATKITGLPLIVLAFGLMRDKPRKIAAFTGISFAAFLVFTIPIWGRGLGFFAKWILALTTHDGTYGGGNVGLPAASNWFASAWDLCVSTPVFSLSILMAVTLLLITKKHRQLVLFTTIALVLQLMMVAKHPSPRYLLPGFAFSGLIAALVVTQIKNISLQRTFASALVALTILIPIRLIRTTSSEARAHDFSELSEAALKSGCHIIPFYRSSSIPFALYFGNNFTKGRFTEELQKQYPGFYVYSVFFQNFLRFDGSKLTPSEVAAREGNVCLFGDRQVLLETPPSEGLTATSLWSGSQLRDGLYRVNFK